jgi:hypothetical protein
MLQFSASLYYIPAASLKNAQLWNSLFDDACSSLTHLMFTSSDHITRPRWWEAVVSDWPALSKFVWGHFSAFAQQNHLVMIFLLIPTLGDTWLYLQKFSLAACLWVNARGRGSSFWLGLGFCWRLAKGRTWGRASPSRASFLRAAPRGVLGSYCVMGRKILNGIMKTSESGL